MSAYDSSLIWFKCFLNKLGDNIYLRINILLQKHLCPIYSFRLAAKIMIDMLTDGQMKEI